MKTIEHTTGAVLGSLTATPAPATIPTNTPDSAHQPPQSETETPPPPFDWRYRTHSPELETALEEAGRFTAAMEANDPPYWLSLLGKSGRGKTYLGRRIIAWRREIGRKRGNCFFWWPDLIKDAREGQTASIMRRMDLPRLAVIDDIGAEYDTDFARAILSEIAERRLNRWTVWTSNLELGAIARIDARVASRMIRGNNRILTFRETPDFGMI